MRDKASSFFGGGSGAPNRLLNEVGGTLDDVAGPADMEADAFAGTSSGASAPAPGRDPRARRRAARPNARGAAPTSASMDLGASSGKKAVEAAEALQQMKGAAVVGERRNLPRRTLKGKTFVREGAAWVDETAAAASGAPRLEVEWGSDAYFTLLDEVPELTEFLALGEEVTVVFRGVVFVVRADSGETALTPAALSALFQAAK